MTSDSLSSIQSKIADLKAKVEQDSISPDYLGALLAELASTFAAAIPSAGVVSAETLPLEVWGDVIHLPLKLHFNGGGSATHRIEIPAATAEKAGLYDIATRKAVDTALAEAKTAASAAQSTAASAKSQADSTAAKVGAPSGIAPLDGGSKVPAKHLPSYVDDVVEFGGCVPTVTVWAEGTASETQAAAGAVVYVNVEARFALRVPAASASGTPSYYRRWPGQDTYGTAATAGIAPSKGKIYIDTAANKQYRWSGSGFVEMAAPTPIGTSAGEAYPGEQGAQLRADLDKHLAQLSSTALTQSVLAGAGVPLDINGRAADVKYNALAIDLPAGRTYEVSTLSRSAARTDMRVSHADGTRTWLQSHLRSNYPFRFTPEKPVTWLGFDFFNSTDDASPAAADQEVSISIVIKAIDTAAETDEAIARQLDSQAIARTTANAGATWTQAQLTKGRVSILLIGLGDDTPTWAEGCVVPLTIAAQPERLGLTLKAGGTGLDLCRKIVAAGGEIATYHTAPLTSASTQADFHKFFVTDRLALEKAGLSAPGNVNVYGASSDSTKGLDTDTMAGYLKAYYSHGIGFPTACGDLRYTDWRRNLGSYTLEEFQTELDTIARNKTAVTFYTDCSKSILKDGDSSSPLNKFLDMMGAIQYAIESERLEATTLKGCTLGALTRNG